MVPLAADILVVDLIHHLRLPGLIVARSGLGSINHTLLTVECLERRGIPILGNEAIHQEVRPEQDDDSERHQHELPPARLHAEPAHRDCSECAHREESSKGHHHSQRNLVLAVSR